MRAALDGSDRQLAQTVIALALGGGKNTKAAAIARHRFPGSVTTWVEKAASTTGDTPELLLPGLGGFSGRVRARSIIGKISGLKRVPFYDGLAIAIAGGTFAWVGQGGGYPVGQMVWDRVSLPSAKAGGIVVLTKELLLSTRPDAEAVIDTQLRDDLAGFLDVSFTDPAMAAVPGESPASITNGAPTTPASGTDAAAARADLIRLIHDLNDALDTLDGAVLIMSDGNAFALATAINPAGSPMFPNLTVAGGFIYGIPVITSSSVGDQIIAAHAPSILVADEGRMEVDISREATLEMSVAPAVNSVTPTSAELVSLWQTNSVALLVKRFINWERSRSDAVHVVSLARYGASEES